MVKLIDDSIKTPEQLRMKAKWAICRKKQNKCRICGQNIRIDYGENKVWFMDPWGGRHKHQPKKS